MFLKNAKISNFRKFSTINNEVVFTDAKYFTKKQTDSVNISPTTTLIVGKNNAGKTTITKALDGLINVGKFAATDFNFSYLNSLLSEYKNNDFSRLPYIEIRLTIGITDIKEDLITNLCSFIDIENLVESEVQIIAKYELKENELFITNIKEIVTSITDMRKCFTKLLELLSKTVFSLNYYSSDGELKDQFKIKDLIELKTITANKISNDNSLSKAFSKIVKYRYESQLLKSDRETLDDSIEKINNTVTGQISSTHTSFINETLTKIESEDHLRVLLRSDLNFEKLLNNLITYEYSEKDFNIPENQFGLGYSNLMAILAEIIDYVEKRPNQAFQSKINIVSIEEPEAYMHPQMQELFIKHINDAITFLLSHNNKSINSQIVITTHSAHILNSKIHSGNTFDNINYISIIDNQSNVVNLSDDKIIANDTTKLNDLKFIKKHIKFKISEMFFSDAVFFVEGVTEETLLQYYIDNDDDLRNYYISVFNINGAHGLVYHDLIKLLQIPVVVITDLDIQRTEKEIEVFSQIKTLKQRKTTNATIIKYHKSDDLEGLPSFYSFENLYITYQRKDIEEVFASSFEEAYILTNYTNILLNNVLCKIHPKIYNEIMGQGLDKSKIVESSYKLQVKLANNKTDFANTLLYDIITSSNDKESLPILPVYIQSGINWLKSNLIKSNKQEA